MQQYSLADRAIADADRILKRALLAASLLVLAGGVLALRLAAEPGASVAAALAAH